MLLAERLAHFVVEARDNPPPPEAMDAARMRLLDGLGVALAALGAKSVVQPRSVLALFGSAGPASAIGQRPPCPVAAAALHNGLLMHALEFDDTHLGGVVHGAPVVLPAVLACGEQQAQTGEAVLRAICIGWEVLARIGAALRGELQRHGFQATSVAGPLAAAAAAAYLSGFDVRRTTHALGIAGSQSSGVFEFLDSGATSKALHGGWAALGGLVAASLAADGMTGPASIIEGRNGLFAAFARAPAMVDRMHGQLGDLGQRWAVCETRPKAMPCCHYIQAFVEALDTLLDDGVNAADILGIRCSVDPRQAQLICEPWPRKLEPATGYAAKWSLPLCLAARALGRALDVDFFETPFDPEVLAYARRIDWIAQEDGFPERYPGRLTVMLIDGRSREAYVPDVLGAADRPFPEEALLRKVRDGAVVALPAHDVAGLIDAVLSLRHANSLATVGAYLRKAGAGIHRSEAEMESA
jgi:2-methylcitrate dehydratase PrpD